MRILTIWNWNVFSKNKLTLQEAKNEVGVDPEVLINNNTYPIEVKDREDKPLSISLDLYETENTLIRESETVELSYNKLESVIYRHWQALQTMAGMKADGEVKMYITEHDPKQRATIIGFDKRFVTLPIRNKGIGAIITGKE